MVGWFGISPVLATALPLPSKLSTVVVVAVEGVVIAEIGPTGLLLLLLLALTVSSHVITPASAGLICNWDVTGMGMSPEVMVMVLSWSGPI